MRCILARLNGIAYAPNRMNLRAHANTLSYTHNQIHTRTYTHTALATKTRVIHDVYVYVYLCIYIYTHVHVCNGERRHYDSILTMFVCCCSV